MCVCDLLAEWSFLRSYCDFIAKNSCSRCSVAGAGTNVTVWNVEGDVDYEKLIEKFGSQRLSPEMLAR